MKSRLWLDDVERVDVFIATRNSPEPNAGLFASRSCEYELRFLYIAVLPIEEWRQYL